MNDWLITDFKSWLETPGPIKKQRSADNKRRLLYMDDNEGETSHGYLIKLKPYRAKWELLEKGC